MSRKRNKQKRQEYQQVANDNRQKNKEKTKQNTRRYIVPLAEWKRFERFKDHIEQIEDALADLQEDWNRHLDWLKEDLNLDLSADGPADEGMRDHIMRLGDLIKGVEFGYKKHKRRAYQESCDSGDTAIRQYDSSENYTCKDFVGPRPKGKYIENMKAEIIVEEISVGRGGELSNGCKVRSV